MYGGTYRYASNIFKKHGISYEMASDLNAINSLDKSVSVVFIETPSNPLLRISDIEKISALAHKMGT